MATNKTYKAQRKPAKKVPIKKKTYKAQRKATPKKTATAPSRKSLKMYPKKKK